MTASGKEVSFEIHVMQAGRWEIYASRPEERRQATLEEAEMLCDDPAFSAVKVIKEVYRPDQGVSEEFVIFSREGRKRPSLAVPSGRIAAGGLGAVGETHAQDFPRASGSVSYAARGRGPVGRKPNPLGMGTRLFMIGLASIAVAAVFTGLGTMFLEATPLGRILPASVQSTVLLAMFTAAFFFCFVSMAVTFLAGGSEKARKTERSSSPAAESESRSQASKRRKRQAPRKRKKPRKLSAEEEQALAEAELENWEEWADDDEEEGEDASTLSDFAEEQKVRLLKFLGESLEMVDADKSDMDAFNKFGVSLYLAGAAEALSTARKLDKRSSAAILGEGVRLLGYNEERAMALAKNYADYMLDRRYMQMVHAGRNAMTRDLSDDPEARSLLVTALKDWDKPRTEEEAAGTVAILFTDLVGSTDMTQAHGDAEAQKTLHEHDRIVRKALDRYAGKEIKHTGDGIMAAFTQVSNSVEAALAIQDETARYNTGQRKPRLNIKIGIHAGETIAENDDHFGTTVQMAARVVDRCGPGQIIISETVRGICAGKPFRIESLGECDLKGFSEPVTLYDVLRKDDKQPRAAEQTPPTGPDSTQKPATPPTPAAPGGEASPPVSGDDVPPAQFQKSQAPKSQPPESQAPESQAPKSQGDDVPAGVPGKDRSK